jgi:hypothetical protein
MDPMRAPVKAKRRGSSSVGRMHASDQRIHRRALPAYTRDVRSHAWVDRRSLALHETVAAKIEARPELLDVARANLTRWISRSPQGALLEWQRLLDRVTIPELVALLRSESETAARLRQSSPFAGILTQEERLAILHRHDPRRA